MALSNFVGIYFINGNSVEETWGPHKAGWNEVTYGRIWKLADKKLAKFKEGLEACISESDVLYMVVEAKGKANWSGPKYKRLVVTDSGLVQATVDENNYRAYLYGAGTKLSDQTLTEHLKEALEKNDLSRFHIHYGADETHPAQWQHFVSPFSRLRNGSIGLQGASIKIQIDKKTTI